MDPNRTMSQFLGMVADCTQAADPDQVLKSALDALPGLSGADAVQVLGQDEEPPAAWSDQGLGWVERHPLPGHAGVLALAWRSEPPRPHPVLESALALLDATLARRQVEEEYDDLVSRVDNAQHLANMGDYDWHVASDTNQWSDQLYRIYGHEPQAFNASYDRFLGMLHPDDRDRIVAVHEEAYRTGEPYQMMERIVRPDGEVRHLASNGQVLMDSGGTPLRFRGTCIDITERVLAEQEREEIAGRMAEDRLRRRQALEINDSVVQGLTTATYALELGDLDRASTHLAGTLAAARRMMDDLLEPHDGVELAPGDLVRTTPASFGADDARAPGAGEAR
jgi:PAS domain S-box-containing protein